MTKPLVRFPDVERLTVDLLDDLMSGETVTVGSIIPTDWGVGSDPHLLVVCDGAPRQSWPVVSYPTVRVVAYVAPEPGQQVGSPSKAKDLVLDAEGRLLAHVGTGPLMSFTSLTGLLTASDTEHSQAALAMVSLRAHLRSIPIT